jgi:hypothetical protein
VIVAGSKQAPGLLTCADDVPKAEIRYEAVSFPAPDGQFPHLMATMIFL